jgi:hypothetical protein
MNATPVYELGASQRTSHKCLAKSLFLCQTMHISCTKHPTFINHLTPNHKLVFATPPSLPTATTLSRQNTLISHSYGIPHISHASVLFYMALEAILLMGQCQWLSYTSIHHTFEFSCCLHNRLSFHVVESVLRNASRSNLLSARRNCHIDMIL